MKVRRRLSIHNRSMGQEMSLKLIYAVQENPCLWMERDKAYKNVLKKNEAWAKLAVQFEEPVEVLKKRWRNLTIQYYSNRKTYNCHLANGLDVKPVWFGYEPMSFLGQLKTNGEQTANRMPKLEAFNETSEMPQTEESSSEGTSPSPPPPARPPPRPTSSQRQGGPSRKRKNNFQEAQVADSLTSLETSLAQVVAVVSKKNKYEGIGQFVADTLAENDGSRIGNAELCSKIFSICALATNNSPRRDIIRDITDKLEQCDDDKFESIKGIIKHMLEGNHL